MAFDLGELVELLQAEVDAPGTNSYPNALEDDWINQLRSAYWEVVLDGIIDSDAYTESDGILTMDSATEDLPRDMQQLVIFYAGVRVVRSSLLRMNTVFRTKAGPVEYETQQSANVLKAILDELVRKRNIILNRLSDLGTADTEYIDMVIQRDDSMRYGDITFIGY